MATRAHDEGLRALEQLGDMLDADQFPHVGENGQVLPGPGRTQLSPGTGVTSNGKRSEAGPEGPKARQGQGPAAGGSPAAGAQALVLGQPGLTDEIRRDLGVAVAAYPSMRVRFAPPVVWLLSHNLPVAGLTDRVWMLTALSLRAHEPLPGKRVVAAAWGWWDPGVWIGPRHTNFGDGSICSFETSHGTWKAGDPIVTLLDLQSVWIARHLYLRNFGRWPGAQVLHTPYERVQEQRPGERCGCDSGKLYEDCHREHDRALSSYARFAPFDRTYGALRRAPPPEIWQQLRQMLHEKHVAVPPLRPRDREVATGPLGPLP